MYIIAGYYLLFMHNTNYSLKKYLQIMQNLLMLLRVINCSDIIHSSIIIFINQVY